MHKSVTVLNANEHRDFRFTPVSDLFFGIKKSRVLHETSRDDGFFTNVDKTGSCYGVGSNISTS